ncbi:RIO1-domain-containing protein [Amanita rubescens]|nr:RIO1-domain-containing protein [Amanita rubescens]
MDNIEPGQFDDAPEPEARTHHTYIDTHPPEFDENLLEYSEPEDDDEDEIDDAYDNDRVEDEDWEIADKDFTKQYNRLRQHAAVRTGNAHGASSAINKSMSVASLPAVNIPKSSMSSGAKTLIPGIQAKDRTTDQLTALAKTYSSRLGKIDCTICHGSPSATANMKDKSDRATNEQVLDPRTRLILFKMIGRDLIHEVNGCVSTGKEANVYHALTSQNQHLALKIYKTSILVFKDRDKYVTGEYRFRRGYSRRNPRKMVRLWAEKEMRNLKRLVAAGIRCPDPIEVRENVLVMTFLGNKEGWASPRLKDAELPNNVKILSNMYIELVCMVRRMYHDCKLVHADLSEYNLLVHDEHLYVIDVSQSVEHDHPSAYEFLRNDIRNVEEFFARRGVKCLGIRSCFEFVTKENLGTSNIDSNDSTVEGILQQWLTDSKSLEEELHTSIAEPDNGTKKIYEDAERHEAHEDAVFLRSFIPRTLNEVYDPERDIERLTRGQGDSLIYNKTIGVVGPLIRAQASPHLDEGAGSDRIEMETPQFAGEQLDGDPQEKQPCRQESDSEEDEQQTTSDDGTNPGTILEERRPRGHRHEDRDAKKERKKAVKAEARERRKQKMPKAEKKKIIKKTKS